jgi:hypothetical protein
MAIRIARNTLAGSNGDATTAAKCSKPDGNGFSSLAGWDSANTP